MANGCLSHGGVLVFHLFGELPDHLIKRVVDRFVYEPVAGIGIEIYLVPILLVEVKRRLYGRISLPQLDGPLRVTLHYHEVGFIKAQHGKHLAHDLEDKGFVVERKRLLASFLRKTVITDCFYIHTDITGKKRLYCASGMTTVISRTESSSRKKEQNQIFRPVFKIHIYIYRYKLRQPKITFIRLAYIVYFKKILFALSRPHG